MWNFLAPPAYKQELPAEKIDSTYKSYRWQVFLGIFIGYAGFYIVRKNFSMAIPELGQFGFEKGELSIVLSMNAVAYALSKFLMGSVSDRSNARVFLPLGLVLATDMKKEMVNLYASGALLPISWPVLPVTRMQPGILLSTTGMIPSLKPVSTVSHPPSSARPIVNFRRMRRKLYGLGTVAK